MPSTAAWPKADNAGLRALLKQRPWAAHVLLHLGWTSRVKVEADVKRSGPDPLESPESKFLAFLRTVKIDSLWRSVLDAARARGAGGWKGLACQTPHAHAITGGAPMAFGYRLYTVELKESQKRP